MPRGALVFSLEMQAPPAKASYVREQQPCIADGIHFDTGNGYRCRDADCTLGLQQITSAGRHDGC